MTKVEMITKILSKNKLRVTKQRIGVASALVKNPERPLTSEEIFHKIQNSKEINCDQVSVYRVLTTFEEIGIVSKLLFNGKPAKYKLLNFYTKKRPHEHYFKCNSCEEVEPFKDCLVVKKEKELEKQGFRNLQHHLEITGICPNCASL